MAEDKKKRGEEKTVSESLLDSILEGGAGEGYDGSALYENYKNLYEKQGRRAAENVFGLAAESTGGYGNTWGATAAAGALGDYADRLAEKAAEIDKTAYDRAKDARDDLYKRYSTAADAEKRALGFAETAADAGDYSYLRELGVDTAAREKRDELSFALTAAANGDYSYLGALGVDTSNETRRQALAFAVTAAQNGDYSYLNALGVDTSLTRAKLLADYGDYSGLAEMGVDLSGLRRDDLARIAEVYAKYGDYSLLRLLGVDVSGAEADDDARRRLAAARYYKLLR